MLGEGPQGARTGAGLQPPVHPRLSSDAKLLTASRGKLALKRIMDFTLGGILFLIVLPALLTIALLIAVTSRGPVLHLAARAGRDGRPFLLLKFRTMQQDAEQHREGLDSSNEQDGPLFKMKNDPRVTRVGRFLRRFSLDELPQIVHVVTGRMSLVGPRPHLLAEVAQYENWERARMLVKPGLTGMWQVNGRSDLDWDTHLGLDFQYIEEWTFMLDIKLLLRTIPVVLSGNGAY